MYLYRFKPDFWMTALIGKYGKNYKSLPCLAVPIIIGHLGQPEELLPLIEPYFIVSMTSVVFVMLANSFRQFVEEITNPSDK